MPTILYQVRPPSGNARAPSGVAAAPLARAGFVDDGHQLRRLGVGRVEHAAAQQRDAERLEVLGTRDAHVDRGREVGAGAFDL